MRYDATTHEAFRTAANAQAAAEAVRDSLGSGTLTCLIKEGATTHYSGTFAGPLTAGADGSLSASAACTGAASSGGTPSAATWTLTIQNAGGTRWIEGTFGPGGQFTWDSSDFTAGQGVYLDFSIASFEVPVYALRFPSNVSGSDQSAPYVALKFLNPHSNGLPIWGPSGAGVTYMWRIKTRQQTGYYCTFWWSNDGSFLWDSGSSNTYVGAHPYPQSGSNSGTTHWWEIAGMGSGADWTDTLASTKKTVVHDTWYTQALRITVNGDGSKTARFYTALSSVANGDVIAATAASGWGESNPPSPCLTWGDSPWYATFQHERMSADLAWMKIFAADLGETDMLTEATDGSAIKTAAGASAVWYHKRGWLGVDDLTCNAGTGRAFAWADASNKATLVAAG